MNPSYLHPQNIQRVMQIQQLVCLESEREAVNLIIALGWQAVLNHLVETIGFPTPDLLIPSNDYPYPRDESLVWDRDSRSESSNNPFPSTSIPQPLLVQPSGHNHPSIPRNDHPLGGRLHPNHPPRTTNGIEPRLFSTLRDVEF